jgi:hypothetical protein
MFEVQKIQESALFKAPFYFFKTQYLLQMSVLLLMILSYLSPIMKKGNLLSFKSASSKIFWKLSNPLLGCYFSEWILVIVNWRSELRIRGDKKTGLNLDSAIFLEVLK